MEDLKNSVKELEKKIDNNIDKIIQNMNKLHNHEEKINENACKIKQNSYALDILKDYKKGISGWRIMAFIFIALWIITTGYLVYVLNDIEVEETTETMVTQENDDGYNNFIGNDGDIING